MKSRKAEKMSELLDGTGHPAKHGFVKCIRCGSWRRAENVVGDSGVAKCIDEIYCTREVRRAVGGYDGSVAEITQPGLLK